MAILMSERQRRPVAHRRIWIHREVRRAAWRGRPCARPALGRRVRCWRGPGCSSPRRLPRVRLPAVAVAVPGAGRPDSRSDVLLGRARVLRPGRGEDATARGTGALADADGPRTGRGPTNRTHRAVNTAVADVVRTGLMAGGGRGPGGPEREATERRATDGIDATRVWRWPVRVGRWWRGSPGPGRRGLRHSSQGGDGVATPPDIFGACGSGHVPTAETGSAAPLGAARARLGPVQEPKRVGGSR
jgi:hypothetical protein